MKTVWDYKLGWKKNPLSNCLYTMHHVKKLGWILLLNVLLFAISQGFNAFILFNRNFLCNSTFFGLSIDHHLTGV